MVVATVEIGEMNVDLSPQSRSQLPRAGLFLFFDCMRWLELLKESTTTEREKQEEEVGGRLKGAKEWLQKRKVEEKKVFVVVDLFWQPPPCPTRTDKGTSSTLPGRGCFVVLV